LDSISDIEAGPEKGPVTLPALFNEAAALHGPRPLMVFDDGSAVSYAEAASLSRDIAARLREMGVGSGDRVVSISAASAESALVFWASMLAGAVFVPLDGAMPSGRLGNILERTAPKAVFVSLDYPDKGALATFNTVCYRTEGEGVDGLKSFSAWLREGTAEFEPADVPPAQDAIVLFTSGTSGEPKGVVLSHRALCESGRLMKEAYRWGPEDTLLSTGDFHTMSGLRNPCVAVLHAGASFIMAPPAERSNAVSASALMERLGATILCTVPAFLAQFTRFEEKVSRGFASGLRYVMCTGTNLTAAAKEAFERLYGVPVLNYYGLTETSGICIGVLPGMEKSCRGTIGVPLGSTSIRLDADGSDAEAGELLIMTGNLMSGYYGEPQGAGSIKDGWYRTRDLCRRRPDGSIELIGRVDDAFKDQRGELVHPSEIEKALEGSAGVLEAAVCGFDDGDGRPAVAAFVVLKEKCVDERAVADELRREVNRALGAHRTPALFRFVDSLPRGTNGKILRRILKEELR